MLQWILSFSCNMVLMIWRFRVSHTHSGGFISFQNTRKFCLIFVRCTTPTTASPLRLLHGAPVILVLSQISQFRSLGKWEQTLCLPKSTLLVVVGSKDGSWEELACESLCSGTLSSTRFSVNSCSHSGMSEFDRSHRSKSWSSFLFGFGFLVGLVNRSHRSFLSTCLLDTVTGSESTHTGLTVL